MAVYTRINQNDLSLIEKEFKIGKIVSFSGIKKGIENTNYLLKTNKKKIIQTIFEKRVQKRDLPFFMPEKDAILPTLKFFSIKLKSLRFILVYTAINLIFLEF